MDYSSKNAAICEQKNDSKARILKNAIIVIVLYKTVLSESLTFKSLTEAVSVYAIDEQCDLLICDNSPTATFDFDQANDKGLFRLYYLHDPLNPGVSKSYNRAAELAIVKNKRWLLLLDQDTIIPTDGLDRYEEAVTTYTNFPLYAPKLYSGALLYSPCHYRFYRGSNLQVVKPGIQKMAHRNVLNSGLFVEVDAFTKCGGYDELVSLYFSDFVFFDRLKKHFREFIVIDCCLKHQLSSVDYSDLKVALAKFSQYCVGALAASKSKPNFIKYILYVVTIGLRSIKMCLRFEDFSFFKIFLSTFF